MDINYELYKVFYYVATSLSFSEASKQLYISQSAVSQSIKTLEKKLNQPLFIRSTKKVQLTPAGKILLKHIEPAMNLIRRGENQLLDTNTLGLGQLHIGASDTICRYFLVPYLKEFHKQFPNVPIKVTIRHGSITLSYCHLSQSLVTKGTHVRPGTPIAITGNSGSRSTGPHLHLTLKDTKKGRAIDPSILLRLINLSSE